VKNTDSRADVAAGLNAAFAGAKLALQATDTGAGVQIQSQNYGSAAAYTVDWGDGNGVHSIAGLDVQGSINGVTATGSGQQLFVPFTDNQTPGLAVFVKTTQTGDLGTVTYSPGIAARVQTAITQANDPVTGFIPTAIKGLNDMISTTKDTITSMEERITQYETMLRVQYATLESTIGNLKSQSNWLAGQVNALTGNTGK
jgi:flagellar hook-associated protein 2